MLKIIFPQRFKDLAPLSYSICYTSESSDTILLHGASFYILEAFSSFLLPLTLYDDVCVGLHSFMLMGT